MYKAAQNKQIYSVSNSGRIMRMGLKLKQGIRVGIILFN